MVRLPIDDGLMRCAITKLTDGPQETAYLNRRTGEIVFVPVTNEEAEKHFGPDYVMEAVRGRAAVENRPSDWVEIPKFEGHYMDDGPDGPDPFIARFLEEHGIEACWK